MGTPEPQELWLGVPEMGAEEAAREGPPAREKPPVVPAQCAQLHSPGKECHCQRIAPLQPCREGRARARGWVFTYGGGVLFKRQGGWNGGSQLAVGSISTDKALPCRCEEFQLNMQPICLCVGEGLLGRRGTEAASLRHPANQKLAPFITGTRGFPQPSCALAGVSRRRQTEEARERLGRRVLQTPRASGISEWAGRIA